MSKIVSSIQRAVPTTGQTVTIANADVDISLIIEPAGTLLALTVSMPSTPYDGQKVSLMSTQILTGLTLSGGTLVGALTTIAAVNGFASYVYSSSQSKWYRIS